jgi:hypothetical protein
MQRDRYEGENMIVPGEEITQGMTLRQDESIWGWYKCTVDTSEVLNRELIDPVSFVPRRMDCYRVTAETQRWGRPVKQTITNHFYVAVKHWDVEETSRDIGDVLLHLEALVGLWLFEPNDAKTRHNLTAAIDRDLAVFKAQGDIYDYSVVCDESNNTPYTIDCHQLKADVAIKPAKAVEFIHVPISILAWDADEDRERAPIVYGNDNRDVIDVDYNSFFIDEVVQENPKPIKRTYVKPGITVTVIDESIYVSREMVDEWNYERAMKVL